MANAYEIKKVQRQRLVLANELYDNRARHLKVEDLRCYPPEVVLNPLADLIEAGFANKSLNEYVDLTPRGVAWFEAEKLRITPRSRKQEREGLVVELMRAAWDHVDGNISGRFPLEKIATEIGLDSKISQQIQDEVLRLGLVEQKTLALVVITLEGREFLESLDDETAGEEYGVEAPRAQINNYFANVGGVQFGNDGTINIDKK